LQNTDAALREVGSDQPDLVLRKQCGERTVAGTNFEHIITEKRLHHFEDPVGVILGSVEIVERALQLQICERERRCAGPPTSSNC
jgi:hypothetical protein